MHLIGTSGVGIGIKTFFHIAEDAGHGKGEHEVDGSDNGKGLEVLIGLSCDGIS